MAFSSGFSADFFLPRAIQMYTINFELKKIIAIFVL